MSEEETGEEHQAVVIRKRKEKESILKYSGGNTQTTEVSRIPGLLEYLFSFFTFWQLSAK